MKFARYGLIAILLNILVLPLRALAVPLNDLLDSGASITEGDKLFSNFTGFYGATAGGNPSSIDVSASTVGGEQRLQLGEGYSVAVGGAVELRVEFDVTVTDPGLSIRRSELVLPRVHLGGDAAFAFQSFPPVIIFDPDFLDLGPLSEPVGLGPTGGHVTVHLILESGGVPGSVDADGIYLALSQSVPEPSATLLLVAGAVLVAVTARRRSYNGGRHRV